MTIQEFLAEQGLTAEEITAVVGNEKQSKAMTAALSKYTEGTEAAARAKASEDEALKLYNKSAADVTAALAQQDEIKNSAARAEAERARARREVACTIAAIDRAAEGGGRRAGVER